MSLFSRSFSSPLCVGTEYFNVDSILNVSELSTRQTFPSGSRVADAWLTSVNWVDIVLLQSSGNGVGGGGVLERKWNPRLDSVRFSNGTMVLNTYTIIAARLCCCRACLGAPSPFKSNLVWQMSAVDFEYKAFWELIEENYKGQHD